MLRSVGEDVYKRQIEKQVENVLRSYGHGHGHVFNLGHGITQWTPPENAAAMLEAVRKHSKQYHQ